MTLHTAYPSPALKGDLSHKGRGSTSRDIDKIFKKLAIFKKRLILKLSLILLRNETVEIVCSA